MEQQIEELKQLIIALTAKIDKQEAELQSIKTAANLAMHFSKR
jgi:peptidoglycan hydrolase CwlO-like protein